MYPPQIPTIKKIRITCGKCHFVADNPMNSPIRNDPVTLIISVPQGKFSAEHFAGSDTDKISGDGSNCATGSYLPALSRSVGVISQCGGYWGTPSPSTLIGKIGVHSSGGKAAVCYLMPYRTKGQSDDFSCSPLCRDATFTLVTPLIVLIFAINAAISFEDTRANIMVRSSTSASRATA